MSFKTELYLKVIGDQAYEVMAPLVYNNGIKQITVYKGFDFDGASVPRPLWGIIGSPMTDGYQRAGCLHDALYASHLFDRETCDNYFLEAMESDGVGYFKRYAMYWAVRAAGWITWEKHKQEEIEKYKQFVTVTELSS